MGEKEKTIILPLTCPQCGAKSLNEFPILVVVTALLQWNHMALYTACHPQSWDASGAELQTIRDYLGPKWLATQSRRLPVKTLIRDNLKHPK